MRNIKMIIEYDGTRYKGWQRQKDSDNTIQGKIESVLSKMTGEEIEIIGSGRTDAGVHSLNQIANFKTNSIMSIKEILEYCYKYLPEDIVVRGAEEASENFHARYNAVKKTYMYRICNRKYHDVFRRKYLYHVEKKLDINDMKKAARFFIGEHDFKSFTSLKSKSKSTVREIYSIDIIEDHGYIDIVFKGNGFLQNMVRILTGTLIEVGLGNLKITDIKGIMDKQDRSLAGPTAPAQGLFLMNVEY